MISKLNPQSEIEYPPSEATLARAAMIARVEALKSSSDALMGVIAERIGAEAAEDFEKVKKLSLQQDELIEKMQNIAGRKIG